MPSPIPTQFTLLANLGRGGMSDVMLAARASEPLDVTKLVVIKMLRAEFVEDADFVTMFLDEARLAARLNHPNVVQTIDAGQEGGEYFLAMEFLEGQTLDALFKMCATDIPFGMHLSILSDVLSGLHYAHRLEDYDGTALAVVHRDVTPHNVFVTYEGQVKIMDFGIAKAAGRLAEKTRAGIVKGKLAYMAPEQLLGEEVDCRTDVFGVGVLLYQACTRRRMWEKPTTMDVVQAICRGEHPRSPRERAPDVHPEIDRICQKALAFTPDERYATALAFAEDLDNFIAAFERRPSRREVGGFVAGRFAERRLAVRTVIDTALAGTLPLRSGSPGGVRAVLEEVLAPTLEDESTSAAVRVENRSHPPEETVSAERSITQLSAALPRARVATPRLRQLLWVAAVLVLVLCIGLVQLILAPRP